MKSRHRLVVWAVIAIGTIGLVGALAAEQRSGNAALPDVPSLAFEKYTLPNGLDVILSENRRLPLVAVNLWYHVGPVNEEAGRTGFAHLFEHMMFQGSKHVPPDTHFRFLQAAGATTVNGTTGFDRTNYFETLPSNQLELGLWLESDRMGYLLDRIDSAALANQQDVVRNERRQTTENRPYGIAGEALIQAVFPPGHPYHANVIGSHKDIQAANLEDVKKFFKLYYAPNNASLAIVGDFDKMATKALIAKYFGSLRRGAPVPPVRATTPPITAERRVVVGDRVELPRVSFAWLTPAFFKPGDAEADIAAGILGGGRSSRLYKRLVYDRQIAQSVTAQQNSHALASVFEIQATASPGHTPDELEQAIDEELAKLRQAPPDAAEVERVRNAIETRTIEQLESLGGFGGVSDRLNLYNHYLGTPEYLAQDIGRYRAITPALVHAFVREHLVGTPRVIVHAVPGAPDFGSPVASPPSGRSAGEGAESVNADEPWRNRPPDAAPARPLRVAQPQTARLGNGLTLMLSQRSGFPVVAADLVMRTGSAANPIEKPGLASFTLAMLDQGTASRTALQIAEALAQLGARLTAGSTMDASLVRAHSLKKNFGQTLSILADVVIHPAFPADEVERQRRGRLAQLAQERENATALATKVTAAAVYGGHHPYGFSETGTEASVKAFSREDTLAFWREHFVPGNAALVVAGDISMGELKPLVETAFGAWPGGTSPPVALGNPEPTTARVLIVDRPGAPQTQLRVARIGAPRATPDFFAIQVMNLALGGIFSSRINMNLREAHGYTYGASSQFTFRRAPGPFIVTTGVRTDVTAQAVSEILKELSGMREKPPGGEELQRAKDYLARSMPAQFETSQNVVGSFSNLYVYDLGLDYFSNYSERVEGISAAAVAGVAEKYLQPDVVIVAVGDRAKIQPELEKLGLGRLEVVAVP